MCAFHGISGYGTSFFQYVLARNRFHLADIDTPTAPTPFEHTLRDVITMLHQMGMVASLPGILLDSPRPLDLIVLAQPPTQVPDLGARPLPITGAVI